MTRLFQNIGRFFRRIASYGREAQLSRLSHEVALFERQVGARESWC